MSTKKINPKCFHCSLFDTSSISYILFLCFFLDTFLSHIHVMHGISVMISFERYINRTRSRSKVYACTPMCAPFVFFFLSAINILRNISYFSYKCICWDWKLNFISLKLVLYIKKTVPKWNDLGALIAIWTNKNQKNKNKN